MTAEQLRAARAMLRMDQATLAATAGVSVETVKRLEGMQGSLTDTRVATLNALRKALEAAGVEFTNGGQPGVRLKISWAFEGLEAIAAYLGVSVGDAERLCNSKVLRTFRTHPDGPWCATREAMDEFIAKKSPKGDSAASLSVEDLNSK
jgi:transcriptional regulator with XRE-family HTH domain